MTAIQPCEDCEQALASPAERRAQTIGEISVTVELHCRAVGYPDLADDLVDMLRQLAVDGSQPASQEQPRTAVSPCMCGYPDDMDVHHPADGSDCYAIRLPKRQP